MAMCWITRLQAAAFGGVTAMGCDGRCCWGVGGNATDKVLVGHCIPRDR
jgi:hypothetical protein